MTTEPKEQKSGKAKVKESKKTKAIVSDVKDNKVKKAKKVKSKEKKDTSVKEKINKEGNTSNYPKFRYWLMDNHITQKDLAKRTHLSVNTVYRLTHFGKGTKSIIKLVAMELNISEEKLTKLLKA